MGNVHGSLAVTHKINQSVAAVIVVDVGVVVGVVAVVVVVDAGVGVAVVAV